MPDLIVIAGCNGAGKSTFASSFLPHGLISFDYDKLFMENYHCLEDSELREVIAKHQTTKAFEDSIAVAMDKELDFCYETNFDSHPLVWPTRFKERGYRTSLIFFCLENQEIARHRVRVRTEFKGHFVDDKTIDLKWKAGYKNVNQHFKFFDKILFVDNSKHNDVYTNLLQINMGRIDIMTDNVPDYFRQRLPSVFNYLNSAK